MLLQKYQLMKYGYDQSLMIRPETEDAADDCLSTHLQLMKLLYMC